MKRGAGMDRQVEKMSWKDYINQEPGEYRLRWIIDYGWIEWEPAEPTPNYNYLFGVTGNNSHHRRGNPDGEHAYVSLALPTSSEIGRYDSNKNFQSNNIIVKCPSKYSAVEEEEI